MKDEEVIILDFPNCLEREAPESFQVASKAIKEILEVIAGQDYSSLAKRSPGLLGFDWKVYISCSIIRMVRVLNILSKRGVDKGSVLDFGSYFGNFSLMCREAGFCVDAVDSYKGYEGAFSSIEKLLQEKGVGVLDFDNVAYDLTGIRSDRYDVVLCMGVIEHIPHTPRMVLNAINRTLKPGGLLIMDTPNLGYLYNRQKLDRGESIFPPVSSQYFTELPFEGHHREYTVAEIEWMLGQLSHEKISIETFHFSVYSLSELRGKDLENYRIMEKDASCRELVLTVSSKPGEKEKI